MFLDITILVLVIIVLAALWSRRARSATTWMAMTTPLASIIGSGFLVLGPILESAYGMLAPLVMAGLCIIAYAFGGAIRYNMISIASMAMPTDRLHRFLERSSAWSLGFAFFVSVAYYLNLFGVFGVSLTDVDDQFHARLLTTAVLVLIVFVGWTRGFRSLEKLEYTTVSLKLAIIAGLLLGLCVYFAGHVANNDLQLNAPQLNGWPAITLALGLLITVQGFETSRYLMDEYDPATCIRSMRRAQLLSTAIYVLYITLIAYVFSHDELVLSETAIIGMMQIVAPILPVLLVAAALAAQFSAAVADTGGSGGLVHEASGKRLSPRAGYAILAAVALYLTWSANVFELISYASRAFAAYYALQSLIAARTAWHHRDRRRAALFMAMVALGILIVIAGQPIEL